MSKVVLCDVVHHVAFGPKFYRSRGFPAHSTTLMARAHQRSPKKKYWAFTGGFHMHWRASLAGNIHTYIDRKLHRLEALSAQ